MITALTTLLRAPRGTASSAATLVAVLLCWCSFPQVIRPAQSAMTHTTEQRIVYGPKGFRRKAGKPVTITDTFAVGGPVEACLMIVKNGVIARNGDGSDPGSCDRVSSAIIDFNGSRVFRQSDFNQQVGHLERPVQVLANNDLAATLASKPGSCLSLKIVCSDVNDRPVANAGPDKTGPVRVGIALDGSASFDPDGDPVAFDWELFEAPDGSTAALDDATRPKPRFTADLPGEYHFGLIVNDGQVHSDPDSVIVTAENTAPIADAGPDLNVRVGSAAIFDGSDSSDPNGDLIGFQWELIEAPEGSTAALDYATAPDPRLTTDLPGDYRIRLTVSDGTLSSTLDEATVHADETGVAPTARAGKDRYALIGSAATLDGSGSYDPNELPLDYLWTFRDKPVGSQLNDSDIVLADTPQAQLNPDVAGTFILNLRVQNGLLDDNDTMAILASDANVPPNADAGPKLAVAINEEATLDGMASIDPDSGPTPLTFSWSLVSHPSGSTQTTSDIRDATTNKARFTPTSEGTYVARVEISDGESSDADNTTVLADGTPPTVSIDPADGATIDSRRPMVRVAFSDAGSGIDPDSFQLLINGADVTSAASMGHGHASYTPAVDLRGGGNQVTVRVADRVGNRGEATHQFTITVFRAVADCGPTLGTAPHTATFRSRGQFTGGSIVRYRWDRDGNGTFDTSDSVPRDYTWTFNAAGTYNSVLEAQNNLGQIATDTCTITVQRQGPTATANASPSNGPVPLPVTLTCQGQTQNGSITRWEWDFDGDGTYDFSSAASGATTYTYNTVGEHAARCRVTDSAGMTGTSAVIDTTVRPRPEGSPTVTIDADRTSGNAPLSVSFSGTIGDGGPIALYEWDFDGDGVFDYSSATTATVAHTYQAGGLFAATLRVTNAAGLISVDSIAIEVGVIAGLSIQGGTFSPDSGGTATVRTTLSGTVTARILITDGSGRAVRTLVNQTRAAGTYNDAWDGRNDAGELLADGVYYAILEYAVGDRVQRLDLTNSSGGTRYNPSRNTLPSTFSPYANNPLAIQITVPSTQGASEILAFVGLFNTDTRLVTLLDRQPLGEGTHTIYWDGLLPNGSFAVPPPGDSFLFGIWGYTLPSNAMYLAAAPKVSSFSVQPTLFSPARDGSRPIEVRFDLDKSADIDLSVTNLATDRTVFSTRITGFTAGAGKVLSWNGLNSSGRLPDRGEYRLALTAIDGTGGTSLTRYMLIRVFY